MNKGSWKPEEIKFLNDNIGRLTLADLAERLG